MMREKAVFPVYSIHPGKKFYNNLTLFGFDQKKDDVSDLVTQQKYKERYELFKREILMRVPQNYIHFDDNEMCIDFIGFALGDYYLRDVIHSLRPQFPWLRPIEDYQTLISRAHQQQEKKGLARDAEAFYKKDISTPRPQVNNFEDLLSTNFIVAEAHADLCSKKFIIENLPHLKKQGYDTLFMEHLFIDTMQIELDNYMNSPPDADMPYLLKDRLQKLDEAHMFNGEQRHTLDKNGIKPSERVYTFTNLVIAAKKAGIRVVGIDSNSSYEMQKVGIGGAQLNLPERIRIFNYKASSIIDEEIQSGRCKKWLALMGNTHSEHFEGYPGVAQIQGAQTVLVTDNYQLPPEHPVFSKNSSIAVDEKNSLHFALSIEAHPGASLAISPVKQVESNENDAYSDLRM